ncbi:2-succinyl-6-hydroxy-2,4-cyclohexadiene-1-carboxylate synthase [Vibrionales bacterium C3R12]|nr:2-succinyl-6-hydroxy-2,4-cyclohexadiene-1-carboxylate synthase [Vibrionales bacterium C3R12]
MLHSQLMLPSGSDEKPLLLFLHGLLGTGKDWQACLNELHDYPQLIVDLPGHGQSQHLSCDGFEHCCQLIKQTILSALDRSLMSPQYPIILVGYSLGGRIAMYAAAKELLSCFNIQLMIIEAGNFGLSDEEARIARWESDQYWAERFTIQPIEQVLSDWYQQGVFSSLNHEQRQTLIAKRSDNLGDSVAKMLLSTSLAKQPYLLSDLQQSSLPIHYLCGEKDAKFCQLAKESQLSFSQIDNAGHNVHQEQPKQVATVIRLLSESIKSINDVKH